MISATEFKAWKCPRCKRVVVIFHWRTLVVCVGGWIYVTPEPSFVHEPVACYSVPDSEADPIELARAMGILEKEAA